MHGARRLQCGSNGKWWQEQEGDGGGGPRTGGPEKDMYADPRSIFFIPSLMCILKMQNEGHGKQLQEQEETGGRGDKNRHADRKRIFLT